MLNESGILNARAEMENETKEKRANTGERERWARITFFGEDILVPVCLLHSSIWFRVFLEQVDTLQGEFKPTGHISTMRKRRTVDILVACMMEEYTEQTCMEITVGRLGENRRCLVAFHEYLG